MLNNFCVHVYAQKSLFIAENCNAFFWTSAAAAAPCEFRVSRPGSQLKKFTTHSCWQSECWEGEPVVEQVLLKVGVH